MSSLKHLATSAAQDSPHRTLRIVIAPTRLNPLVGARSF